MKPWHLFILTPWCVAVPRMNKVKDKPLYYLVVFEFTTTHWYLDCLLRRYGYGCKGYRSTAHIKQDNSTSQSYSLPPHDGPDHSPEYVWTTRQILLETTIPCDYPPTSCRAAGHRGGAQNNSVGASLATQAVQTRPQ